MGLETAVSHPLVVEPRHLVAAADPNIVTPTAVDALTDAYRKGAITVDDIQQHAQQTQKNAIDIQNAQREQAFQNDPMVQEVKKTVAIAAGAKAKAETDRANREVGMGPLLEMAARAKTIREIDADKSIGESEKLAVKFQAAGEDIPKTSEGFVDVPAARQTEEQINTWSRNAVHDAEVAKSIKTEKKKFADGHVELAPFSEVLNRFLTPEEHSALMLKATNPQTFKQWKESQAPLVQPNASKPALNPMDFQSGNATPRNKKIDVNAPDISGIIQAKFSPLVTGKAIDRTVEEPQTKALTEKNPTENQGRALLALPRFAEANTALQRLQRSGYDPTTWKSWVDSSMPEVLKSGNRKEYETAVAAWSQGLLRLESGAAISVKEQLGYEKAFFPLVGDTPQVVQQKEKLRHAVEETVAQLGAAGNISPEISARADALFQQALVNAGGKLPVTNVEPTAQQVNIPGLGAGTYRNGKFYPNPK